MSLSFDLENVGQGHDLQTDVYQLLCYRFLPNIDKNDGDVAGNKMSYQVTTKI